MFKNRGRLYRIKKLDKVRVGDLSKAGVIKVVFFVGLVADFVWLFDPLFEDGLCGFAARVLG